MWVFIFFRQNFMGTNISVSTFNIFILLRNLYYKKDQIPPQLSRYSIYPYHFPSYYLTFLFLFSSTEQETLFFFFSLLLKKKPLLVFVFYLSLSISFLFYWTRNPFFFSTEQETPVGVSILPFSFYFFSLLLKV